MLIIERAVEVPVTLKIKIGQVYYKNMVCCWVLIMWPLIAKHYTDDCGGIDYFRCLLRSTEAELQIAFRSD